MRMSSLRFRALSSLFVTFTMLSLHAHAQQQSGTQSFQFMNHELPVDQRVNDLIGRMTLEEKVADARSRPRYPAPWRPQIRLVE
jgi:beta-glucosidase